MPRRPFMLLGDGPNEPTGLGKIARDLGSLLDKEFSDEIDLVQVGGPILPPWTNWRHVPMPEADRRDDWGAGFVEALYRELWGDQPGTLFAIWDPARLYPYLQVQMPVDRWMYCPIDGVNIKGTIGGPAAVAVQQFDRVLAYGRWGSKVLKPLRNDAVPYLPHGIPAPPREQLEGDVSPILGQYHKGHRVIGCVATNQARKDLALYCHAIRILLDRGHKVYGWLHTDTMVKAWSLPELIAVYDLQKRITVTSEVWAPDQLRAMYSACSVTIAPGLAEGFGYPIVESLSVGTPCVHVDHGGGRELIPASAWRFPVREMRVESVYAIQRPVANAEDVANAIERIWSWEATVGREVVQAYCRGAVEHLSWSHLWPRWRNWIRQGLVG